jgi:hypothetical protein
LPPGAAKAKVEKARTDAMIVAFMLSDWWMFVGGCLLVDVGWWLKWVMERL